LAYAKFFAFVFVLAWLLVQRKYAALLPWAAVLGFALWHPSLSNLGIAAIALALTLPLLRGSGEGSLDRRRGLATLSINLIALWAMTYRVRDTDPVSLGLLALGVPDIGEWRWLLLPIVLAIGLFVICANKVRLLFILLSSYVFYAHWDWRFFFLIWGSSTVDWLLGNAIAGAADPKRRRRWLAGTVVLNLGVLAIFKYFNFLSDSVHATLTSMGGMV